MSDYNSECIALQKIAMVRRWAPFSEGGCKPPGARKEASWSYGSLGHVTWFAGSVPPLQFPCWVGFISLWPRKESPCTPGDKFSCSKFSSSGPGASAQRSREGGVHFLSPFDVGKEILCSMKTIPLPPMGIHHHIVMHGSHAATSPLPSPTARVSQRDSYLFSGGCW